MTPLELPTDYSLLPLQLEMSARQQRADHFLLAWMGTGKTPTTVYSLYHTKPDCVIILCPKNAIRVWEDHIIDWFLGLDAKLGRTTPFIIRRWRKKYNDATARKLLWREYTSGVMNIYITTNAGYLQDKDCLPKPQIIIQDEAKRILGRTSDGFKSLKEPCRSVDLFWPMTGTPGYQPKDIWTLFHLADHKYFGSYWKFVNAYHYTIKNEWGRQEILTIKNKENWYATLRRYASVITKEMMAGQLPPSNRVLRPIQMDDVQQKIYTDLKTEFIATYGDTIIISPNTMTSLLKIRQLLCCPKIIDPALPSYGAALEDFIYGVKAGEISAHSVIFVPFTEAFPHFRRRLQEAGWPSHSIIELSGDITPDEQQTRIAQYRKSQGTAIVSILYAQAFSLEPATESFFMGYDFDPDNNAQAEARLVRLTSDRNIPRTHYYYTHEDTYDYEHLAILTNKTRLGKVTYDTKAVGLKI